MIKKNQENNPNKKQNQSNPTIRDSSKNKNLSPNKTANTSEYNPDENSPTKPFPKSKISLADRIQIFLLIVNIIMVAAFIVVSLFQRIDTQEALSLTRKSLIVANGANIIIVADSIPPVLDGKFRYNVIFNNLGQTPAINVNYRLSFGYVFYDDTTFYKFNSLFNDSVTIAPQVFINIPYEVPPTKSPPKNKLISMQVRGFIEYDNVFNNRYRIDFVFKYAPGSGKFAVSKDDGYIYQQLR